MALFSTVIAITSLLLLISVAIAILRSARLKVSSAATQQDPTTLFLRLHRSATLLPPVFSYDDLAAATHNFDPKRKIGDDGFGSVYLAQLRDGCSGCCCRWFCSCREKWTREMEELRARGRKGLQF